MPARPAGSEVPRDVAYILSKAMREEPEERYASVDLFIGELQAYLDHRPVQARRGNALYKARKFMRRRWLPMAAGTLAMLGMLGGLIVAEHQRAVAQGRFQQVRQLFKQFLELDTEIRALPGSTKARNRIVSASLEYLDRLGGEARPGRWSAPAGQDVALALEIGSAYLQVARVQGVPTNSNLGQFAQAGKSLSKADFFVESVLAQPDFPKRRSALRASAEIATDAMIVAQSESRVADALAFGRTAAARLEALLAAPAPTQVDAAVAARSYANLALAHSNMHRLEEAARYAKRSVEIARSGRDQRQLSKALSVFSNTARFAGDLDGALEAIRESREIAEKMADPEDTDTIFNLCAVLWREGRILGELDGISFDRPREAVPPLRKVFEMAEAAARKDPQDSRSRTYVAIAGRELGDILRESDPVQALEVYDHAHRRIAEVGNNASARREEVWLLAGSSYALRRLGRPGEAMQRIEAALAILRDLKAYPAATVDLGEESDTVLRALADHYGDTGQTLAAIKAYEELHAKVMASNPQPRTDLRHANGLAHIYRDLENLHSRSGHVSEAHALRQRRLELWLCWDQKLLNNPFVRRQLTAARLQ
jgi:tetratricopeptide (TPR) repeat protein